MVGSVATTIGPGNEQAYSATGRTGRSDIYKRYFDPTPASVLANGDALEKFAHLIIEDCKKAFWSEECFVSDLAIEDYNTQVEKIRKRYED